MAKNTSKVIPIQQVESLIFLIRGQKVMTDSDLAALYGVSTKALNQAVRRNRDRFPDDFMFQLSKEEFETWNRSQIVTGSEEKSEKASKTMVFAVNNRSQFVTAYQKHRDPRFRPYVFTEQGIAMLSSVLRSPRAVQVNIEIMRAFVKIRQWLSSNAELSQRLDALEKKYDAQFKVVFDAFRKLMETPVPPPFLQRKSASIRRSPKRPTE